jgi:hypothetical protein
MNRHEIFDALEEIADYIHSTSPTGLITREALCELLTEHLAERRADNPRNPSTRLREEVDRFLRTIEEHVGLLAARGQNLYGFRHLTFQEFLAARYLVRDLDAAPRLLRDRLEDPRWREPILMALGYVSRNRPRSLPDLVRQLLEYDGELRDLVPRSALLVVDALPDMVGTPPEVTRELSLKLLRSYADRTGLARFEMLRERLEDAFDQLRQNGREQVVEDVFREVLEDEPADGVDLAPAAAQIIHRLLWFTPSLLQALMRALPRDNAGWGWPIDAALRAAVTPQSQESGHCPSAPHLEFRRKLDQKPELLARILADPGWFRLTLALYGGLQDYEYPVNVRSYHEIAAYLQMPDNARRPFEIYYGEIWGQDDPTYNMALYLDTTGPELRRGEKIKPVFATQQIFRDSPLTPLLLASLSAGGDREALARQLRQRWERGDNPHAQAEAMLGLVALGSLDAAGAAALLAEPAMQEARERFVDRLGQLLAALRDPVARAAPHLRDDLSALANDLPAQTWINVVAATLATTMKNGALPFSTMDLMMRATQPGHKAYLLAENLAYQFSGFGDDGLYNAAVFVDTYKPPPDLLVLALLRTAGARQFAWPVYHYGWTVEKLPPRTFDPDDIPLAALTALENAHSELYFVREWAVEIFLPLLERNPDLKPELLAFLLDDSDRDHSSSLVSRVDVRLAGAANPHLVLLQQARNLANPYHQARTLLRLLPHFTSEQAALVEECCQVAQRITNPHHRAQVLERLIPLVPASRREALLIATHEAARAIDDPDNQARALGRLAFHHTPEERAALLHEALDAVARIVSDNYRALSLQALRPQLLPYPALLARVHQIAAGIRDGLARAKAFARNGPVLLEAHPHLAAKGPEARHNWAPVVLAALLDDVMNELTIRTTVEDLWSALAADPSEARVQVLQEAGVGEGLVFTRTAAEVLDALLGRGESELIRPLWPLLARAEPETYPVLDRWVRTTVGDACDYASLLLAEGQGIRPETVRGVVALLSSDDDHARYRAGHAIHHPSVTPDRRTKPLSVLGRETLEELFRASLCYQDSAPALAVNINWIIHDLVHDRPEDLRAWAEALRRGGREAPVAAKILGTIESLTGDAWEAFLELLGENHPGLCEALLHSLCRLVYLNCNPPADRTTEAPSDTARRQADRTQKFLHGRFQGFLKTLPAIDLAPLQRVKVLQAQPHDLIRAIQQVLREHPHATPEEACQAAERYLEEHHSTTLAALLGLRPDAMLESMYELAATNIYTRQGYFEQARQAAEQIKGDLGALRVLLVWLGRALTPDTRDPEWYRLRDNLLVAAAGVATTSPTAFANLADPDELEPRLVEAVQRHNGYPGRHAAVVLLGCLRRVSTATVEALHAAMRDVVFVQHGALDAVRRFRHLDGALWKQLFDGLRHPSAMVSYATARVLAALGRGERTRPDERRRIIRALAEAILDTPLSSRIVHFGHVDARVPNQPRLDQVFYRALMYVAGME